MKSIYLYIKSIKKREKSKKNMFCYVLSSVINRELKIEDASFI